MNVYFQVPSNQWKASHCLRPKGALPAHPGRRTGNSYSKMNASRMCAPSSGRALVQRRMRCIGAGASFSLAADLSCKTSLGPSGELASVMPQNPVLKVDWLSISNIHGCMPIRTNLCNIPEGARWADKAAARCHSCLPEEAHSNLCQAAPELLIHQYLNRLDPDNPQGNLLSLKAYLMTQARPLTHT